MFDKKKKIEESIKETPKEKPKEEKIINKTIPNAQIAVTFIRDMCYGWIMNLANIDRQTKCDLDRCLEYLQEYVSKDIRLAGCIQEQINKRTLDSYSKSYIDSGYKITLTITKEKK